MFHSGTAIQQRVDAGAKHWKETLLSGSLYENTGRFGGKVGVMVACAAHNA